VSCSLGGPPRVFSMDAPTALGNLNEPGRQIFATKSAPPGRPTPALLRSVPRISGFPRSQRREAPASILEAEASARAGDSWRVAHPDHAHLDGKTAEPRSCSKEGSARRWAGEGPNPGEVVGLGPTPRPACLPGGLAPTPVQKTGPPDRGSSVTRVNDLAC
jgi:hypothetical protein